MASILQQRALEYSPAHYAPSETALLLLDYKDLVIRKIGLRAEQAVKKAADMRVWAEKMGITVIHGLVDFHGVPPYATSKEAPRLSALAASVKVTGDDRSPDLIAPQAGEGVFKRRMGKISALQSPGIEQFLQDKGIRSLIIAGLSTGGCVLRTSFDAADKEYVVTILEDACADAKNEVHAFYFQNVFQRTSFVSTSREFQELYGGLY